MIYYDPENQTGPSIDEEIFRKKLLSWGKDNYRSFPWRETNNPYFILVAELLLHRTRAEQVEPVYLEFIRRYPDPIALSNANTREIMNLVSSLGLFWRSELIHTAASYIVEKHEGRIPPDSESLMKIPGVGHYITAAIRCFAYNLPDAIIDTNVVRVITRVAGISVNDSLRRNRKFITFARQLVDPIKPREYNFALLDLANKICLPRNPLTSRCPLEQICIFARSSHAE